MKRLFYFLITMLSFLQAPDVLGMWQGQGDSTSVAADSIRYWEDGVTFNLNLQQVSLTNWAAGGESSIAIGATVEAFSNYEREEIVWENRTRIAYGVIRNGDQSNRFEKTNDVLSVNTKYSQKFSEQILMSAAINFKTQMDDGFKLERVAGQSERRRVLISDFMAPGYLQASLGLSYRSKDNGFDITVAPFTGRFTFVLNDSLSNAGSFGVLPGEQIRSEAGISVTGSYKTQIMKNIELRTNYNLFSNYEKFPTTVVNLEGELNLKVNEYIQSKISSQLIFDEDVLITRSDGTQGKEIQLKNVITVGFTLSL